MMANGATLTLAEGLGARPDHAAVARSRQALAQIESDVALRLKAIAETTAMEKLAHRSVLKLDELHQIYESLVGGCNTKAPECPPRENMEASDGRILKAPDVEAEIKVAEILLMADAPPGRLDLSGLLLHEVPRSIEKLSGLVKLDLSNNNLRRLPESVTGLVNLTCLDVHSNQLTSLPDSIGRLAELKVLNVASNSLAAFPDAIENCRALEELCADFNQIRRLPETVGFELVNLRKLSVHSNRISYLPSSTAHMTSLRVLDVHLNNLRRLPEDIGRLVNLEYLNVSKNFSNFVGLPESIGGLRGLIEMDVSYNQIRRLPNSVGGMEKLAKLAVEGNPLIEPPAKVAEDGLEAIKQHLSRGRKNSGASWWLSSLVRCSGDPYEGGKPRELGWQQHKFEEEEVAGFSSPRRVFSPRRLFSPSPFRNHSYSPLRV